MALTRDGVPHLGPDAPRTDVAPEATRPVEAAGGLRPTTLMSRAWPALAGLALGCVAASVILSLAVSSEFPLFAEASAARGRDCAAIRSARHALDRAIERDLREGDAGSAESATDLQAAVASFRGATDGVGTRAVVRALEPVDRRLHALAAAASAATVPGGGDGGAVALAVADAHAAWSGPIARVCS